jgi:hypothetical protein
MIGKRAVGSELVKFPKQQEEDRVGTVHRAYQHGLSAVKQCFSLTAKQPQPAYKPQKQPTEQVVVRRTTSARKVDSPSGFSHSNG